MRDLDWKCYEMGQEQVCQNQQDVTLERKK